MRGSPSIADGTSHLRQKTVRFDFRKKGCDAHWVLLKEYFIPYYSPKRYSGSLETFFQLLPVLETRFDFLKLFLSVPTPQNREIGADVNFSLNSAEKALSSAVTFSC